MELVEIENIKKLKARYFRCMDTKDWNGWRDVFTEDATLLFDLAVSTGGQDGNPAPRLEGREAIVDYVADVFATAQTMHHGHMPEIDLVSDSEARGIWAMEDIIDSGDGDITHGFGHYHETYRKVDGAWKIAATHLTRVRIARTVAG
ncbi:nuclear transport factor 2 family protein [Haliea sp. E17]|uniref:nuclear transport factor 2 family protein n=1 Tax=Haliea sp. E17 TaxID=3401576 RepID=UPI003AAF1654